MIQVSNPKANYLAHKEEIDDAIHSVLDGGQYILGDAVDKFEQEFAEYIGVKHCIGVASGTDALTMIMRALGIGEGDEIITVANTATGTVAPIKLVGATPVYAPIDQSTMLMDDTKVGGLITKHTRAILPVHLFGGMCDTELLKEISNYYGIYLIEDACQAHGAQWGNLGKAGSVGIAGAFSFYPTKNLSCIGDGGAITTDNDYLAEKLRKMRFYDWDSHKNAKSVCGQSRLDAIQAAVLSVKLKYLDAENQRRGEIADIYKNGILDIRVNPHGAYYKDYALFSYFPTEIYPYHVYHQFVPLLYTSIRESLIHAMRNKGVEIGVHYPTPVDCQDAYRASIPRESLKSRIVSLPMYPELTDSQVGQVITTLKEVAQELWLSM